MLGVVGFWLDVVWFVALVVLWFMAVGYVFVTDVLAGLRCFRSLVSAWLFGCLFLWVYFCFVVGLGNCVITWFCGL